MILFAHRNIVHTLTAYNSTSIVDRQGVLWKGMIKTIIHAAGILAAVVFVAQDHPTLKSLQLSRMCV